MIFIKEYKGFDIMFDETEEKFTASGNTRDKHFVKPSIAAVKKAINEFIIENVEFGEFKIQDQNDKDYKKGIPKIYTVIGMTSDKRLRFQDDEGKISTFSKYDYDRYIMFSEANQEVFQVLADLEKELDGIREQYRVKKNKVRENLKITTLGEYLKKSGMDVQRKEYYGY